MSETKIEAVALDEPTQVPDRRGEVVVQIQRTVPCGRLRDGRAVPGAAPFDIAAGEQTNFEQYCRAIAAARRSKAPRAYSPAKGWIPLPSSAPTIPRTDCQSISSPCFMGCG